MKGLTIVPVCDGEIETAAPMVPLATEYETLWWSANLASSAPVRCGGSIRKEFFVHPPVFAGEETGFHWIADSVRFSIIPDGRNVMGPEKAEKTDSVHWGMGRFNRPKPSWGVQHVQG